MLAIAPYLYDCELLINCIEAQGELIRLTAAKSHIHGYKPGPPLTAEAFTRIRGSDQWQGHTARHTKHYVK